MIQEKLSITQPIILAAPLVDCLVDAFNREGVLYSHWKSNIDLDQATAGEIDLDLLVERKSLPQALTILAQLGFKAAVARWGANQPGIRHYYGLDPSTQELIHVHLFSRVLTGESYVKSHLFPFEAMLLNNVYYVDQMRVTSKAAELVLFTLRMFIKYGSLLDLVTLRRKSASLQAEVRWLQEGSDRAETLSLLRTYCPVIDEQLFTKCIEALDGNASLLRRMILAQQVRRRLKVYAKHSPFMRLVAYMQLLWAEVQRQWQAKPKNKVLQAGGAVIAFVGADATGKSTLVTETGRWLGDTFAAKIIHTGKPPSSWVTAPVNLALHLMRRFLSLQDISQKNQAAAQDPNGSDPNSGQHRFRGLASLPFAVRALTLAWDRQRLILRTRRRAAAGEIIICDRYPSRVIGAMDSPRLVEETHKNGLVAKIYNRLARLEKRIYRQIPPPDIVLKLNVSLETAQKRNSARNGQDGEAYLVARHRQSRAWHMSGVQQMYDIDTEQTLAETIWTVKEAIWGSL